VLAASWTAAVLLALVGTCAAQRGVTALAAADLLLAAVALSISPPKILAESL
jgi:hypothetical protein